MTSLSLHGKTVAFTVLPLLLIGLYLSFLHKGEADKTIPPTVVIEHDQPITFSLSLSMRDGIRMIDIAHDSKREIFVSVPAEWRRGEVRGVALNAVASQEPALGFVRWHLPPKAEISFKATGDWRRVTVQNPRHIPLTLRLTAVDLARDHAEHDVFLLKDETVTVP